MLWEKSAYFWAIGASLMASFSGAMAIATAVTEPKPPEQLCRVAEDNYGFIQQCPIGSVVVHSGNRLGVWDGVSIED